MAQQEQLTAFGHALAGALGGVFSNAVVYPLDTAKTRLQAAGASEKDTKGKGRDGSNRLSIISLLMRILKEEGVKGYYGGFGASMANTFFMQYAYFFFYSFVRTTYLKRLSRKQPPGKVQQLSTPIELLLGAIAGALSQIFTLPVSVIATRQQIKSKSTAGVESDSFVNVGRNIVREDGVAGLWAGIKPSMVLTVNPAITYGAFERVKSVMLASTNSSKLTPGKAFLVGALSKTLATVVTYPYIMAKVRLQAGSASGSGSDDSSSESESESELSEIKGAEEGSLTASYAEVTKSGYNATRVPGPRKAPKPEKSAVRLLAKVLREHGVLGWYQGMGAQIAKAVLAQALLFMLKDQFERYALVIMLFVRKIRSPKP